MLISVGFDCTGYFSWQSWSCERWQRYPSRPRGVLVDFDTSALRCAEVCQAAGLSISSLAGDRVRICTSGERELNQAK